MAVEVPTFQELYDIGKAEVTSRDPELTDWSDGSVNDAFIGAGAALADEVIRASLDEFSKQFIDTAEGADLVALLVDRFGVPASTFDASASVVPVTFTTAVAYVEIPAGTTISGEVDGERVEFTTDAAATITSPDTTVEVDCTCTATGKQGNVAAGVLDTVEDGAGVPLDPDIVVSHTARAVGGGSAWSDARVRAYARAYFQSLSKGTELAVYVGALAVPGVAFATIDQSEIGPDDGGHVLVYVGDEDGYSNSTMTAAVTLALMDYQACGVKVYVVGMERESVVLGVRVYVPSTLTDRVPLRTAIITAIVAYGDTLEAGASFYSSQAERATLDQDDRIVDARAWTTTPYTAFDAIAPTSAENCLRVARADVTVEFVEV
jgi:hypothetical protein